MNKYTADFETATWNPEETWVWAWAVCNINNTDEIKIGNNIDTFIEFCKNSDNSTFYFHNLKFDSEFIIYYLLTNGFTHIQDKKDRKDKTFTTLISDMGQFYSLEIYFEVKNKRCIKATFIDSLKIIPFKVEVIAKSFDLEISKLKIDYNKPRPKGWKLTKEEREYITNDVKIVAEALQQMFDKGLTKMTQGSNALSDYKKMTGKYRFKHFFPELDPEVDSDIRKAYKGGFTYLNPLYSEKQVGKGVVLDVNSLYPWAMRSNSIAYGEPVFFKGKYKEDKLYNLYVQQIVCRFKIKKNKIPTIQIKSKGSMFIPTEYLTDSGSEPVPLVLTSIDLKLFFEQYDVSDLEYISGWKFKSVKGLFTDYIDKWTKEKIEAGKEGNKGKRTLAKLMLNSLYGKLATCLNATPKVPYILDDGIVRYKLGDSETKKGIYIPAAAFITAYAREKTIRTAQAITDYSIKKYGKDLFIYSDTDSIHTLLPIEELTQFCEIDDYELGYWAHEASFDKAVFIRSKCYAEYIKDKLKITCAGMPPACYPYVTFENFRKGLTVPGKLTYSHIKGGVLLVPTDFTIKF